MIRLIGYFFGIGSVFFLIFAGGLAWYVEKIGQTLPDYEVLADYKPPVTTRVHASDGAMMAEYARERRLFLPIQAMPSRVKNAFLAAEDKNFYSHPGVDIEGIGRAIVVLAQGGRMQGASTITQQVAKNFLLSNERTFDRKVKEAILSMRIEQAYSKDKILELYLNEIYLGMGAYGVAAASLSYFDKSVNELTIEEAAYLGALPKAPENYNPYRNPERAIARRNWVIAQMASNGFITEQEADLAKSKPLGINPRPTGTYLATAEYFTEDVRREIVDRYGIDALYEGGLSVRTTLDPQMQKLARTALQSALVEFDTARGFRGPVKNVEIGGDWGEAVGAIEAFDDVPQWRLAIVLSVDGESASIGLQPRRDAGDKLGSEREIGTIAKSDMAWAMRLNTEEKQGTVGSVSEVLDRGDIVYVEKVEDGDGDAWRLRQPPEIQGGLVAMEPETGRVRAMVGGFSYAESEFNRASQAYRQPGSSFKPFVYATALDNGYTPASVILDAAISMPDGNGGYWTPSNYGGGAAGPSTLRLGIEKSRNLMTVRLARDMGMKLVAEYAERFGIYDKLAPFLPMSLGAGETTVLRMVGAYSVLANGGRAIEPTLIDRVQDRYGRTIYKHDQRFCAECNVSGYSGQAEPTLVDERDQVLDPMTAYQITSMMEGVVQRGTATSVKALGFPVAGKTGTTNEEKDVWFVGFTPDLVVGVYLGYDQPRPMGKGATGGGLAAPVFVDFMSKAMEGKPAVEFTVPEGMEVIAVNRSNGMRASGTGEGVIMEAFKPGTGPADSYSVIGMDAIASDVQRGVVSDQTRQAISQGAGGLF
ncbi:penicillin-binding protein 1A [Fulvimarina sp. 2208YS6-2-32]|uniref:Penicillin-binding protein 1A n=1 Tax=Fulvimarina uroteuthidis TaxID=3098149 RepID=A0ABU5I692_9HYPH|nr:penicillin-binding protein 1A [Fulvimarina sp. 2208YS6-2-32]MDY8110635.1 penicillin-binding protein 1A [Fulvimarina sp. 2208YS6-2-32]